MSSTTMPGASFRSRFGWPGNAGALPDEDGAALRPCSRFSLLAVSFSASFYAGTIRSGGSPADSSLPAPPCSRARFCSIAGAGPLCATSSFRCALRPQRSRGPCPSNSQLTRRLLHFVAAGVTGLANLLGIAALQRGNVIEIATGTVGIEAACSGVESLQAGFMAALFLGEFFALPVARRIVLVALGAAGAILANFLRVLWMVRYAARHGPQAALDWHGAAGLAATAALFSLLALLARYLTPSDEVGAYRASRGDDASPTSIASARGPRPFSPWPAPWFWRRRFWHGFGLPWPKAKRAPRERRRLIGHSPLSPHLPRDGAAKRSRPARAKPRCCATARTRRLAPQRPWRHSGLGRTLLVEARAIPFPAPPLRTRRRSVCPGPAGVPKRRPSPSASGCAAKKCPRSPPILRRRASH